jgi:hypothetical protein
VLELPLSHCYLTTLRNPSSRSRDTASGSMLTCFRVIALSEFPRDRVGALHKTPVTPLKFVLSQSLTQNPFCVKMSREESPFVRAPAEDEGYNSIHRAFLQAFHTHSVLTVHEIKPILAHIMTAYSLFAYPSFRFYKLTASTDPQRPWSEGDVTQPYITSTIQTINGKIEAFDYEIRSTRDQQTKESVYALVNNASDTVTQLATTFSANEIAYIRRVLDRMFETNNTNIREVMAVKETEASQLARISRRDRQSQANSRQSQINGDADDSQASADTGISIAEADQVLKTLVSQAFFQKSRAGYYSLAPRALIELRAYLKDTYNESAEDNEDGREVIRIRDCEGCKQIVTFGIRCNNRECGVRWHDACATGFYRGRRGELRKCPKCQTECKGDAFVGERAAVMGGRASTGGNREEDEEESE